MYYVDKMFEYYIIFCFIVIAFQLIEKYLIPEGKYKPEFTNIHTLLFLVSIVWVVVVIISWVVCIPVIFWFFRGEGYFKILTLKCVGSIFTFVAHFVCTMSYNSIGGKKKDEKED